SRADSSSGWPPGPHSVQPPRAPAAVVPSRTLRPRKVLRCIVVYLSVAVMGVESDLHAEGLGQLAFLQAVQTVEAVVELVELAASGFVREQFTQWLLQGGEALAALLEGGVDVRHQALLILAQQGL